MADDQRSDSQLDTIPNPAAGDDGYGDTDPESINQGANNAGKGSSGNSALDPVQDARKLIGNKPTTSQNARPQNQGHFPGNKPGQAGKAEQVGANTGRAGANAGRAGGATPGQGAAGGKGASPTFQQAGANAGNSGTKTAGQTAQKGAQQAQQAGQKTAQQAQQAGRAAANAANNATNDPGAEAAGIAARRTTEKGVRAVTGDDELGKRTGAVAGDAATGSVALGETIASGGADAEAEKELVKLAWKYKNTVLKGCLYTLIVLGILFSIIIVDGEEGFANEEETSTPQNELSITQNGPTTASNGNILSYTITVSYPNPFEDIKLTNILPVGTEFVSSSSEVTCNNGDCNESSRIVYWSAKENNILINPIDASFTLRLRAKNVQNNTKLPNIIRGVVTPPRAEEPETEIETETETETTPE